MVLNEHNDIVPYRSQTPELNQYNILTDFVISANIVSVLLHCIVMKLVIYNPVTDVTKVVEVLKNYKKVIEFIIN